MKYLALIIFSTVSLISKDTEISKVTDCFDYAVDRLLEAEIYRGSPMNDEEAFQYLNWSQTICEAQR
jgi:hypothetical protein